MKKALMIVGMLLATAMAPVWAVEKAQPAESGANPPVTVAWGAATNELQVGLVPLGGVKGWERFLCPDHTNGISDASMLDETAVRKRCCRVCAMPKPWSATFIEGEPMRMELHFRNLAKEACSLYDVSHGEHWSFTFTQVGSGKVWKTSWSIEDERTMEGIARSTIKLAVGQQNALEMGLERHSLGLLKPDGGQPVNRTLPPGKYTVTASYAHPGKYAVHGNPDSCAGHEQDKPCPYWRGTVTTGPVEIEIKPRPAEVVMSVVIPERIAVPPRGGETKFEIGLRIANRTGQDLSFDLFDTVRPVLEDNHAPSRELPLDGGRNATRICQPIEVKAGETNTVLYAARLSLPEGKTFPGLVVDDRTGGVWVYNDLKPGRYTLWLKYAHPPTGRAAQPGRWVGATMTAPADFLIGRALEVFGIEETFISVGEEFSLRLPYAEPPLRAEGTSSSDQAEYLGYAAGYLRFKARKEGMPTLQYVEFDKQGRPSGRGGAQADIIDPAAQADMLAKWPAAGLVFLGTNTALILARPTKVDLYRLDPEDYFVETVPGSRRPDPRIQGYMPLGQKTLTDEAVVDKIAGLLKSDGLDAGSHRTGDETVPKPTVCVRVYRLEKKAEFLLDLQSRTFSVCTPNVILDGRGWRGSHRATGKYSPESAAAWTVLADELIPKK